MAMVSAAERTAALTALITEVAAKYNVRIIWQDRKYRAYRRARVVKFAAKQIRNMAHFAVALHEIGHIVGKSPKTRLEREYCAWQWAVDNSPVPFDEKAFAKLYVSLTSYILWAKLRQHRKNTRPVIPPPDHPMWSLLAEARRIGSGVIQTTPVAPVPS